MQVLFMPIVLWKRTHFALLDYGTSDSFISLDVVLESRLKLLPLKYTIKVMVANCQTLNVCHFMRVRATSGDLHVQLLLRVIVTALPIVLGYPFLHQFDPLINWKHRTVQIIHNGITHIIPWLRPMETRTPTCQFTVRMKAYRQCRMQRSL